MSKHFKHIAIADQGGNWGICGNCELFKSILQISQYGRPHLYISSLFILWMPKKGVGLRIVLRHPSKKE